MKIRKKNFNTYLMVTLCSLILAMLPGYMSVTSYMFLGLVLLFDYKTAPIVFFNLSFLVLSNESISSAYQYGALKYIIIIIFFIKSIKYFSFVFFQNKNFLLILFVFILILFHSFLFSSYTFFSILKILIWFVFISCFLLYFNLKEVYAKDLILIGLYFSLLVVCLISFFLHFVPSIGYALNGSGLQGLTNQPQVLGCVSALFGLLSTINFFKYKKIMYLYLFSFSLLLVYLSESRTAGMALFGSLAFLFFSILISNFNKVNNNYDAKSKVYVILGILFFPLLAIWKSDAILKFINKRESSGFTAVSESSRAVLIEPMLKNIEDNFSTGIGFGIPSNLNFNDMVYLPFLDLPISLPTEKGVFYIANIEELGIFFGTLVFLILFIVLMRGIFKNKLSPLIIFVLFSNLTENTFFSIGGLGMLLSIFMCLSLYSKTPNSMRG